MYDITIYTADASIATYSMHQPTHPSEKSQPDKDSPTMFTQIKPYYKAFDIHFSVSEVVKKSLENKMSPLKKTKSIVLAALFHWCLTL